MKLFYFLVPLLFIVPFASADEPVRERIEWIDIWVTDADKSDLPRVLLVGDSITRGYFSGVEEQLAGKAYCARLTTSKCVSDPTFDDDLMLLLKQYEFSMIHFNNGLHGWGYSEEQYRDGLAKTVGALKEHVGADKLIWATTTPVREKSDLDTFAEKTGRVEVRNKLAAEIMTEQQIPTDDLFELVKDHPAWTSGDGVHFNGHGNEALAKQVAESVAASLSAVDPSKK